MITMSNRITDLRAGSVPVFSECEVEAVVTSYDDRFY